MLPLLVAVATQAAETPTLSQTEATACRQAPPKPNARPDLWGSQDALIANCIAQLPERAADRPNVYTVAIAPLGIQTLFAREAKTALQKLAAKYGGTARRGVLLSNGAEDLMQVPLATQQNITRVFGVIGGRMQASPNDVLIVYLTSHGGPDAALQSALPGNLPILAVTADSLAAALEQAGIRRRIIIISACFAGSWIPKLASDDTIVIAAARADRTSFGCDDSRPLTYFGEAFLTGPLSSGASLAEAFESSRRTVTQWELAQKVTPSEPQMFVGKNMQKLWRDGVKAVPKKVAVRR